MIVLGLLLIVLAAGSAVWLVMGSESITTPVDLTAWGITIGFTPLTLIITGAAVLLVLWLGLALIRGSVKRRRRPSREAKAAQRQAELEENIRADERSRAEETHQGTLADRDRVRDEEFQSRLAKHDQERDEEFRSRQAEEEQRIRTDERARVEEEYRSRESQTGAAAVPTAAAGTAGAEPEPEPEPVEPAASQTPATDATATGAMPAAGQTVNGHAPTEDSDDGEDSAAAEPGHHRTVADEIMDRSGPSS